jgi:hypothetical protein
MQSSAVHPARDTDEAGTARAARSSAMPVAASPAGHLAALARFAGARHS